MRLERNFVTFTDDQGAFTFEKVKDLEWLLMVDYVNRVGYRVEAGGYSPFETNLYGTQLHDLGEVRLLRQSHEIEPASRGNR